MLRMVEFQPAAFSTVPHEGSSDLKRGFLCNVLTLKITQETAIVCLRQKLDVTKSLKAEEKRMRDIVKIIELYWIRDGVFGSQNFRFHRSLNKCVRCRDNTHTHERHSDFNVCAENAEI